MSKVEQTEQWTMQKALSKDPAFTGPLTGMRRYHASWILLRYMILLLRRVTQVHVTGAADTNIRHRRGPGVKAFEKVVK